MADETNDNALLDQEVGWSPDEIPNEVLLLPGLYDFEIEELKKGFTKTGKLMPKGRLRVNEPAAAKGQSMFVQFVIGSDEHPNPPAGSPEWKNRSAVEMAKLLKKSGTQLRGGKNGFDETLAAAKGQHFIGEVGVRKGKDQSGNPRDENFMKGYYALGEKQPGLSAASAGMANTNGSQPPLSAEEVKAQLASLGSADDE